LTTLALAVGLVALWLILAAFFAGIGALVLGKGTGLDDGWPAAHAAFWAGAAVVICALLTWHLFWPVNGITFGTLAAMMICIAVKCAPSIRKRCRKSCDIELRNRGVKNLRETISHGNFGVKP
jgi:hypothetical protein